jgi:hypothetical protein
MSDEINRYALMMEALNELKGELKQDVESTRQVKPTPVAPSLNEVLADYGPMPHEALFLGVASDDLPVLLNLHDPVPGPILLLLTRVREDHHASDHRSGRRENA